jgi:hypothetical protein
MFIECPHCKQAIEVVELNCRIFRCGIYKSTFKQVDPHLPKDQCDKLAEHGTIYGCGKPFQIVDRQEMGDKGEPMYNVVVCEYI